MTTTLMSDSAIVNLDELEKQVRDMAGTVASYVANRYTKTMIRSAANQMEGAIGLYMVITGQASHTGATAVVAFRRTKTVERVNTARDLVKGL